MRIVAIDPSPIIPLLNTARSEFAMWVNFSMADMPKEMHVKPDTGQALSIKFVYEHETKRKESKITAGTTIYHCAYSGIILGLSISARNFMAELRAVLAFLKEELGRINKVDTRNNYRFIRALLQAKANDLFVPAQ